ncbi:MAG: recombination mediator RecR [Desulfarculus sp.]|nr:recombination mediator RecR [Pseudomonadota bacterium]MBV1717356.1 recombination mediator RecR [Desulfarculus sp.]MBU4576758.1 recombination mediator RecR [Pseudomonadota bacterium]MBU4596207.1 recombination mediator RecR [Pseudomonadota bacterium]MBV1739843.1 recombination mediator RecR [Desulfarculus sp.]
MYPKAVENLMAALSRLPGIGSKTAERLALFLVRAPAAEVQALARAVAGVGAVKSCGVCFNLTERDPCPICADPGRDAASICVVETPADLTAMEAAGAYKGRYHVLSGALSPLDGVGPEALRLRELVRRVKQGGVREVIIATNPTVEGEATADLVARSLEGCAAAITRLGYGMPVGGDLKYMDGLTLSRSLASRSKLK